MKRVFSFLAGTVVFLIIFYAVQLLLSGGLPGRFRQVIPRSTDDERNAAFREVYDQQLAIERQRLKQQTEHLAIEADAWRKYAERERADDARAARYEAVLRKWEEQEKRFDAILDQWEKITTPAQSAAPSP